MIVRCDEAMKRSKMRCRTETGWWKCNKDCLRCICGIREVSDGEYAHNNMNSKRFRQKGGGEND